MTLQDFESIIGYTFDDSDLLESVLTHTSVRNRRFKDNYERLEFLGDRVLGLVIAEALYKAYPKDKEGDLAKRQSVLVSRDMCTKISEKISLKKYITSYGTNNAVNSSVLANTMETLIGGMYIDGGLQPCRNFILKYWNPFIEKGEKPPLNPKNELQEWAQNKYGCVPTYELLGTSGPQHAPIFKVLVKIGNHHKKSATGHSKKEAEKSAAHLILNGVKK